MGSNASGKTTLGRMFMDIFNFIAKKDVSSLHHIGDRSVPARFSMDFVLQEPRLYRIDTELLPSDTNEYAEKNVHVCIRNVPIYKNDSYERAVARLEALPLQYAQSFVSELGKIKGVLGWRFSFPGNDSIGGPLRVYDGKNKEIYLKVLSHILMALDPAITKVEELDEVKSSYVIYLKDKQLIMQEGKLALENILSSGTIAGIEIAAFVASLIENIHGFYYSDERFPFVYSDIEKAIIAMMIEHLHDDAQLFVTTHNMDVLDMNLPKHAFTFMRKSQGGDISAVSASEYLKKNTESLRNAVANDLFSIAPKLDLINELAEL